jgi:hypothetical protein
LDPGFWAPPVLLGLSLLAVVVLGVVALGILPGPALSILPGPALGHLRMTAGVKTLVPVMAVHRRGGLGWLASSARARFSGC